MRTSKDPVNAASSDTIEPDSQRRKLLAAAAGFAAAALAPGAGAPSAPPAVAPGSNSLRRFARMFGGRDGEDVLWWFMEEIYLQTVGESVVPLGRPMTLGVVHGLGGNDQEYRYRYREAGVLLDLATAEPLRRNPITGAAMETPVLSDPSNVVEWKLLPDGTIAKRAHDRISTAHQRWTITGENVFLLETHPGPHAFALASGDAGADGAQVQSTHTFYARRKDLEGDGFVPTQWIFNISTRTLPAWLSFSDGRERRLIVRGLGTKSRVRDIVNPDTLDWVRKYYPGFL